MTESRPYDLSEANARNPLLAATILSAIATITTIIRFAARKVKKLPWLWDDYLLLLGICSGYIELALYWFAVILGGVGRHMDDIAVPDILLTLKLIVPFEMLYNVSMTGIKLSILAFYFRLFSIDRRFRTAGLAIGSFILVWAVASIILIFFICQPFAYSWDTTIPGGKCGNRDTMYITNGAFNMVNDLLIMALPLRQIYKLQLPTSMKLGLVFCFGLGIFVTIISVIRLRSLIDVDFTDVTYTCVGALSWTCLEEYILTINANLPILRPFFQAIMPKTFGKLTSMSRKGNTNPSRSNTECPTEGTYPLTKKAEYLELQDVRGDGFSGQESRNGSEPSITSEKSHTAKGPSITVTREFNLN